MTNLIKILDWVKVFGKSKIFGRGEIFSLEMFAMDQNDKFD